MQTNDLEEHLVRSADSVEAEALAPQAFAVHDESTANWAVRKVREARAYAERVEAWAAAEIRRARREEQFFLSRFGGQLESWLRRRLEEDGGGRRSVNLPGGTLGLRSEPPRLVMVDEPALVTWCRLNLLDALHVRVEACGKEALDLEQFATSQCPDSRLVMAIGKAVVNSYFGSTGDLPVGVEVVPRQDLLIIR